MFKSKTAIEFGAHCLGEPRISANPLSMTHNLSHSSTRIRNVLIIVSLFFFNMLSAFSAGLASVRPPPYELSLSVVASASFGSSLAAQDGYGWKTGDFSSEIVT